MYDSACHVCVRFRDLARRWDSRGLLEEADLDSPLIQEWAPGFRPRERPKNFHLIHPDSRVSTGEMALPELLALLPGGRPLAWLLRNLPGSRRWMFMILKRLSQH